MVFCSALQFPLAPPDLHSSIIEASHLCRRTHSLTGLFDSLCVNLTGRDYSLYPYLRLLVELSPSGFHISLREFCRVEFLPLDCVPQVLPGLLFSWLFFCYWIYYCPRTEIFCGSRSLPDKVSALQRIEFLPANLGGAAFGLDLNSLCLLSIKTLLFPASASVSSILLSDDTCGDTLSTGRLLIR